MLDWNANPIVGDFGISALDADEVFSDGERIFSFGFDSLIESLSLLFVRRVEFNAWVSLEEPLEPIVFMIENLALDISQPHDLRHDNFLNYHFSPLVCSNTVICMRGKLLALAHAEAPTHAHTCCN